MANNRTTNRRLLNTKLPAPIPLLKPKAKLIPIPSDRLAAIPRKGAEGSGRTVSRRPHAHSLADAARPRGGAVPRGVRTPAVHAGDGPEHGTEL